MFNFRAQWSEEAGHASGAAPHARTQPLARPRVGPPRPRWVQLYFALGVIGVIGTGVHFMIDAPALVEVADIGFAFALLGVLAGWVRLNRIALSRLDEPDAGAERSHLRVIPSARRPVKEAYVDDGIVRLEPGDRALQENVDRNAPRHGGL